MTSRGGGLDEDLAGTWTVVPGTVLFEHDADTFIRDMQFGVEGERLVGEGTFDDVTVRVELGRR